MAKQKLTLDYDFAGEYDIICICSHLKDYKLVWNLNNKFEFNFRKTEDFIYENEGKCNNFSLFYYSDLTENVEYYLINNRKDNDIIFQSLAQVDYLLILKNQESSIKINTIIKNISDIKNVLTVFKAEENKLKTFNKFISYLEESLLIHQKANKNIEANHENSVDSV